MSIFHAGEVGRLATDTAIDNDAKVPVFKEDGTLAIVDKDLVGSGGVGPPGPAGPGSISFADTVFLSENGDDADSGDEITQPKQTLAAAITAASAKSPSQTNIVNIRVEDGSVFTGNFTIPSFVALEMPNATINATSGVALTVEDFVFVNIGQLTVSGASTVGIRKNSGTIGSRVVCQNIAATGGATCVEHTGTSTRLVVEASGMQVSGDGVVNTATAVGRVILRADAINLTANNARAIHQNSSNNDFFINAEIIGPLNGAVTGSVAIDGDAGRVVAYVAEMDGVTDIDVANNATVNVFDSIVNGAINVASGGKLNARILEFNDTLTNNGEINGIIGTNSYGNATFLNDVTINGEFGFDAGDAVDQIRNTFTSPGDNDSLATTTAIVNFVASDTATHIVNVTEPVANTLRFHRRNGTTFDIVIDQIFQAPAITAFSIVGQSTSVPANTQLTGSKTFSYTVSNPSNVSGNLTLTQTNPGEAAQTLASDIDPTGSSTVQNINTVTLAAGESVVFTLSGTDTQSNNFSDTFTIRAPNPHEFLYSGRSATNNPASVPVSGLNSAEITASGQSLTITTGTTAQGEFFIILVPTSEDISTITDTVLNTDVTSIFTRTEDVRQINSINYTSYVVGPFDAGVDETYVVVIS